MSGWPWPTWSLCGLPVLSLAGQCREGRKRGVPGQGRAGAPGLTGSAPRPSEQEQMEEAIRAELWKVLDTSDLESITSKEVGRVLGPGRKLGLERVEGSGCQSFPLLGTFPPSFLLS